MSTTITQDIFDQINSVYAVPEVAAEHRDLAESIAESTDLQELPW